MKEEGVYSRVMRIYSSNKVDKEKLIEIPPESWITDINLFGVWERLIEGSIFWYIISILWQQKSIEHGITKNPVFSQNDVNNSIYFLFENKKVPEKYFYRLKHIINK